MYKCRKPIEVIRYLKDDGSKLSSRGDDHHPDGIADNSRMIQSTKQELSAIMDNIKGSSSNSNIAQRKVAHALLTMAKNDMMLVHFIYKGTVVRLP